MGYSNEVQRRQKQVRFLFVVFIILFGLLITTFVITPSYIFPKMLENMNIEMVYAIYPIVVMTFCMVVYSLYKTYRQSKDFYITIYGMEVVRMALDYNEELSIRFEDNKFRDKEFINDFGIIKAGDKIVYNQSFNGAYGDIDFQGAVLDSYMIYSRSNGLNKRKELVFRGLVGQVENIKNNGRTMVIYHKLFNRKVCPYNLKRIRTGNKSFDFRYKLKGVNDKFVMEFLTDDILNAIVEAGKFNAPHSLFFYNGTLKFAIDTKTIGLRAPVLRALNREKDNIRVKKVTDAYIKLINIFK